MITTKAFNEVTAQKRRSMAARLKPRYWKSGKRAGMVRTPGCELPFSLHQFRQWAMEKVGLGIVSCHYCPRPVDVLSFEPDHYVPIALGGSFGLDNLVVSCSDCNKMKDSMLPQDFIDLMKFLETNMSRVSANNVTKRLRAGSMGIKNRFHKPSVEGAKKPPAPVATTQEMDFF
ncbi:MAG TPA: HNH endonuclease [Pyrinomonadaceae bacterium]|jgi:hypothetical protein|nr:HNH endonuclease [Pyrinomonadaceae bacterium]